MKKATYLCYLISLIIALSGCATHRIDRFKTFAHAGNSYTEAMVALTEEVGNVAIDADSELLVKDRDKFSIEERRELYSMRTHALEELLVVIRDLRSHTTLLRRYFAALSELAESDAPSSIGQEATNVVTALQEISPRLENATIGDASVSDFIGTAVPIVVAHFKQGVLENELKINANAIAKELELQNAVLSALATEMSADLEVILKSKAYGDVAKPYIYEGKLPSDWKKKRRDILTTYVSMASVENASRAANELKNTFIALVEKKIEPGDFNDLFADINSMLDLIELVRGKVIDNQN